MDTTWVFNKDMVQWIAGPKMKAKREEHSCFYDQESNSVFVVGGFARNSLTGAVLSTTERLNLDYNVWESTPSFPLQIRYSQGVASKSTNYA